MGQVVRLFAEKQEDLIEIENIIFAFCAAKQKDKGILTILDRLYKTRRMSLDHLLVLRHYGGMGIRPSPEIPKRQRAAILWNESMEMLLPYLQKVTSQTTRVKESE